MAELTDIRSTYALGKEYEAMMASQPINRKRNGERTKRIDEIVGERYGVNASTVDRAYKFSQGMDAIRKVYPTLAEDIMSGKRTIVKKEVIRIGTASDEDKLILISDLNHERPMAEPCTAKAQKIKARTVADRVLKENISQGVHRLVHGSAYEVTIDDLVSLIQDVANTAKGSLKSILNSRRNLVEGNREKIHDAIDEIFTETIQKMKEDF